MMWTGLFGRTVLYQRLTWTLGVWQVVLFFKWSLFYDTERGLPERELDLSLAKPWSFCVGNLFFCQCDRFTKTESSAILSMEVKNTCPVGWGSFSARGIEKNRIWRCFSTAGIFTTGHSGIFRPGGNYWCGTTNNTPSSLMYQRWWKQGL